MILINCVRVRILPPVVSPPSTASVHHPLLRDIDAVTFHPPAPIVNSDGPSSPRGEDGYYIAPTTKDIASIWSAKAENISRAGLGLSKERKVSNIYPAQLRVELGSGGHRLN